MNIESVKQFISPVLNHLPFSDGTKDNIVTGAHKVSSFVIEQKTKIFFASTVLFTVLATATPFAAVPVTELILSGVITACTLMGLITLFGHQKMLNADTHNKLDFLLGVNNLCGWYIQPHFGVGLALFNLGFQASSFAYRKFFEIKKEEANV